MKKRHLLAGLILAVPIYTQAQSPPPIRPAAPLPAPGVAQPVNNWVTNLRALVKNGNNDIAAMSIIDKAQKNDFAGVSTLVELANGGNATAQGALGYALDNDAWGLKSNPIQARKYLELAAPTKDVAKYNLGVMLWYGRGGPADQTRATDLWRDLANKRINGYACVRLAIGQIPKNPGESLPSSFRDYAQCASDSNIAIGNYLMGLWETSNRSYASALTWYQKGVDMGDNNGFLALAKAYEKGLGTSPSKIQAGMWWLVHVYRNGKEGNNLNAANLSRFNMTETERQQATIWAQQWISTHNTAVKPFNFSKTVLKVPAPGGERQ